MNIRFLQILLFTFAVALVHAQQIQVDQLGYSPHHPKDFRINFEADSFQVLNQDNQIMPLGNSKKGVITGPQYDPTANEQVWKGDFSAIKKPGTYRIVVENYLSHPFKVSHNKYQELLCIALRGIYASRCSYEVRDEHVPHPKCHLAAGQQLLVEDSLISDRRDVTGGWHNGGDYRRSTLSHAQAVNRMLSAVELFPSAFDNLPPVLQSEERIAGMPDLLVEAKWGIDWLLKMVNSAGGVSVGLGPPENSMPGLVPPEKDTTLYYLGDAFSSNTGKTGAILARANRVYRNYDKAFAQECQEKAILTWNFLEKNGKVGNPNTAFTYRFDDTYAEDFLWLSMELYINTGDQRYHNKFSDIFNQELTSAFPEETISTHTMRTQNLLPVLLRYCSIMNRSTDPGIKKAITNALPLYLNPYLDRNTRDGYGNILPSEFWQHRHTVGNMLHKAWLMIEAYELTKDIAYRNAAVDQLHILLGRNALGKVFITGVGSLPVTAPHYRPFNIKNTAPPGLPVKGPTHDETYLDKNYSGTYPPPAKAYDDNYNKHWVNEPDIEVMGYLIAFSAYLYATFN
jgi:endoglucanase